MWYSMLYVVTVCVFCYNYILSEMQWNFLPVFLLVKHVTFVSSLLILFCLQLLSKQIGISGHIHRLVAGSMAGKLSSSPIRPFTWIPCTVHIVPLTISSHVNVLIIGRACIDFCSSWIIEYVFICHLGTDFLIMWQILHHQHASKCHALLKKRRRWSGPAPSLLASVLRDWETKWKVTWN